MTTPTEPTKAKRNHVNFSRVNAEVDGKKYRFSLTKTGLVVRQRHSRRTKLLSFSALTDLTIDQRPLL